MQQWFRERVLILRYTSISCRVVLASDLYLILQVGPQIQRAPSNRSIHLCCKPSLVQKQSHYRTGQAMRVPGS